MNRQLRATRGRVWVRWIAGAVILVALYAALGFWAVPFALKYETPKLAHSRLERQASIGHVRFNPFTLRLQARDLRLAERDGAPLFSVGRLAVQLDWRSIVRRAWTFTEISVAAPQANLVIAADGRFNLAELLAAFSKQQPRDRSAAGTLPRFAIGRFVLQQGKVDFRDRRVGYSNVLSPIDFTLTDFSTLPDQRDRYQFSARSTHGGKVLWHGEASLNPIGGSGELTLQDVSLPELAVYLKPYTRASLAAGQLSTTLPYRFSYADGRFDASLAGAGLDLRDLAVARQGAADSFASLTHLIVKGVDADWKTRQVTVGQVRADGGKLSMLRDANGQLDLANLMVATAGPPAATPVRRTVAVDEWKLAIRQVLLDQVAINALDETVQPPVRLAADKVRLQLQLAARLGAPDVQLKVWDAAGSAAGVSVARGAAAPLKVAALGFEQGSVDLAQRKAVVGRLHAQGGTLQVTRDRQGRINVLELLPQAGSAAAHAPQAGTPWTATAQRVDLSGFSADIRDEASGAAAQLQDITAELQDAGTNLKQPVKLRASLRVNQGGELSAQGTVVPDTGALDAQVRVSRLALAPIQPLLRRFVKLRVAQGSLSAQGRLTTGPAAAKRARLRYVGSANVAGLVLKEHDGDVFASWKNLAANRLTASIGPNFVDVPELGVTDLDAKLIIENDRSFNAARLLVRPPAAAKPVSTAAVSARAADDPFPVRIGRVRLRNAKVDFTDLSLRPQFAAKIYELGGVVTGVSTRPDARSRIELDGRVDAFGMVRVRGDLNLFAPAENTDVNVVFRNVDMVPASPYSMKFAGYKVAEGKISLDLQYKVHDRHLVGNNQIVIDRLTLGERVDSPDALKLPLQLAIAILKDKDGRIELGLPVTGDLNDPQFSYSAIIWKAVGNLLSKIVTAPFRALGGMLGGSGEQLEAIDFDPGSDRLLPPEREKVDQVARILAKRPQLKLTVPARYGEAADGAALRGRAVRLEVARRAGLSLDAGEQAGPLDFGSRKVRAAVRDLYVARFGQADFDRRKHAAENAAASSAPSAPSGERKSAKDLVPWWQRIGKVLEGEPQVADEGAFYDGLMQRLAQEQPLAPEALKSLGARRADSVVTALKQAGVDGSRVTAAAPEPIASDGKRVVPLKLQLDAR